MSGWVEYCNLEKEGRYARWRIANGSEEPHNVRYWSIGNENYGHWEIGAKKAREWAGLVRESAKMIRHVDPEVELSAAALPDLDWNVNLLGAMKREGRIKIAFDEWNLRSWHHPKVHSIGQGIAGDDYLAPRDLNDDNSQYTMADAVFSACFLDAMDRHCDVVGMANFAPVLNTRGSILSHPGGIVLRSTYQVFDLYVNNLGDRVVDCWIPESPRRSFKN